MNALRDSGVFPTTDHLTPETAIDEARRLATITAEAHTICAIVDRGVLAYVVFLSSSYAMLRERRQHHFLAPVASVLPNGTLEVYPSARFPHA